MCPIDPNPIAEDHYKALGLQSGATDKEIGTAFKRLALKYHPDKNLDNSQSAEAAFKGITKAYDILRDPEKRHRYDNSRNTFSFASSGHCTSNPGTLGSSERADELYKRFFGGDFGGGRSTVNDLDISSIFRFNEKPKSKSAKVSAKSDNITPVYQVLGGTSIVIHGLANKTEHNGKSATVREWNAEKGRYQVALNCGGVLYVRPQNITQLCHVQVTCFESRPELHGKMAEVVDFNEETRCYVLLLEEPASVVEMPPSNCIFTAGTAGTLQGLSDEQLCGQMCSIVGVDHDAMRYVVQCVGGRQLKVRFEKLHC